MTARLAESARAYNAQAVLLADALDLLPEGAFAAPSVLPGWDLRALLAHVVSSLEAIEPTLRTRCDAPGLAMGDYVRAYAPAAADIGERAVRTAADAGAAQLLARLRAGLDVEAASGAASDAAVLAAPRGPLGAAQYLQTRIIELVVHSDDVTRSLAQLPAELRHLPGAAPMVAMHRPALATTVRALAQILTEQVPGRSVEVRIPPFVAVQAVPGPRHTRGTPPNVVETDPSTWLRVATGRAGFAALEADGTIRASGNRADLTAYLPLLR